jgi:hypothetical protein
MQKKKKKVLYMHFVYTQKELGEMKEENKKVS